MRPVVNKNAGVASCRLETDGSLGTELQLNSFQTAKRTLFPLVGVLLRRALLFIGDS